MKIGCPILDCLFTGSEALPGPISVPVGSALELAICETGIKVVDGCAPYKRGGFVLTVRAHEHTRIANLVYWKDKPVALTSSKHSMWHSSSVYRPGAQPRTAPGFPWLGAGMDVS